MEADGDACDVSADYPPGPEHPLPEYGELHKKRYAQTGNVGILPGKEDKIRLKREECLESPMKSKCLPKEVVLPFLVQPEDIGRYLETPSQTGAGPGNLMKAIRVGKGKVVFPGWLVELADPQLQSLLDAKKILASSDTPFCEMLDSFYEAISGLGTDITIDEVKEIIRRIPNSSKGYSFSHFMFIAGNPAYARKKGVLQDPLPSEAVECREDGGGGSGNPSSTSVGKKKKNVVERLYQLPTVAEPDPWPPKEKKTATDESGYTTKEQLFYSGLLYCEMYDTIQAVERLYRQGQSIPEPRDKFLKRQQAAGFGVSNLGVRKFGFAEWDRPLPPLPKISPYISEFPLVGIRRKILKPNGNVLMYKRSNTSLRPLFLAVQAPVRPNETIKVLTDERRIKSILNLLASEGNCLAMLPNVHCIIHLSDTLLSKIEEVQTQAGPSAPKLYRNNDLLWITKEAKNLFRPHGLPAQIAKIPPLITFSDGLKLREICKQVREQHWAYICLRKMQFRDTVWQLMHVDRIPCGNLRESFVYSFQTYLPEKPHFPMMRDNALPW